MVIDEVSKFVSHMFGTNNHRITYGDAMLQQAGCGGCAVRRRTDRVSISSQGRGRGVRWGRGTVMWRSRQGSTCKSRRVIDG